MPKENVHISKFTVGEFSAAGLARVDLEITPLAAEIQENIFPQSVGSGIVRPGTQYLGTTASSVIRLMPFVRSVDDVAMLELSDGMLRVWVDDAPVSRAKVDCQVTNTRFDYDGGWTKSTTSGSYITIAGNLMTLEARARGSECWTQQTISTSSVNVEHALRVVVDRGPVRLRVGYSSGGEQYIEETSLDRGVHSLAFTPTFTTFYVRFTTRLQRKAIISQVSIETEGTMEIDAPWSESHLKGFRYDQSADVMFLANRNVPPLKIERRGDHSWSVVYYEPDDGPFQAVPVSGVSVQPSATYGEVTLTADRDVFDSNMVGSLVRLFHERMDATWELAGNNTYTDVFQIRGVKAKNFNDRQFSYQVTGTWSGTLIVQRSITGEGGDFLDYNRDDGTSAKYINGNISVVHKGEEEDDNVIGYMRIGFVEGQYTSGTATVSVQYEGDSGYGIGRITGVTSGTSCTVEVLEPFNATTKTASWSIGAWSAYNGWPSAVALYDGRIWWGALDDFWGSASDNFYGFDDLEPGDSATISRQVATGGQVSRVAWILPLQRLIVGTSGSEVSVRSSSLDRPLTPTNITLKDASTYGSADVSPVRKDSKGIFVHRSGKKVMALGFSFDDKDYRAGDLTELNEDICGTGITELAIQREPETYVWCVREDGKCAILIYDDEDPENKIQGWSKFVTDGRVDSVCVLPGESEDDVYLAIDRSAAGEANDYTPSENATNAEILADGRAPVAAFDFIDQSVWVRDPNNSDYDYDGTGRFGTTGTDLGNALGPDLFFQTWGNWAFEIGSNIYTRQADGRYCLQYHNYMHNSEDFRNRYWQGYFYARNISFWYYGQQLNTNTNTWQGTPTIEVQHQVATSPRGDQTASKLIPTTSNVQHWTTHFHPSGEFEDTTDLMVEYWNCPEMFLSIYVKADGLDTCQFFLVASIGDWPNTITDPWVNDWIDTDSLYHKYIFDFDLTTGDLTLSTSDQYYAGATSSNTLTLHDYYAVDKGDGWWRVFFRVTSQADDSEWGIRFKDNLGNVTFANDGTSGILVWGAQMHEVGTPDNDYYWRVEDNLYDTFIQYRLDHFGLPYEWDASGNPLGIRVDQTTWIPDYTMRIRQGGALYQYTTSYNGDYRDRRTYVARVFNGTIIGDGGTDPTGNARAGKFTDGPTGIVTPLSTYYTGFSETRGWKSNDTQPDVGRNTHAIFVKYDGSAKYFTLSQTNTAPATQDAWYSCTWDIETGTRTEEYYQPGSGAGWTESTDGFIDRTNGIEVFANGWYRIWVHGRSDVNGGDLYWAFSDSPTPGSNTNGIYPTSTGSPSNKHLLVWGASWNADLPQKDSGPAPMTGWFFEEDCAGMTLMLTEDLVFSYQGEPYLPLDVAYTTRRKVPWNRPDSDTDMRQCFTLEQNVSVRGYGTDLYSQYFDTDIDADYHDGWEQAPNDLGIIWEARYYKDFDYDDGNHHVGFTIDPHDATVDGYGWNRWPYEVGYPYTEDYTPSQQILEGAAVSLNTPMDLKLVFNGEKQKLTYYQDGVFKARGSFYLHFDEKFSEGDDWESLRGGGGELMWRPHWSYLGYPWGGAASYYLRQLCLVGVCGVDGERYIEKLAHQSDAIGGTHNKMADSFIYEAGPASSVVLPHIGSRDVVAWGTKDGVPYALYGLSSDGGVVNLGDTYTDIYCGISYQGLYKSAKLAYAAEGGTALTMPKRVSEIGLLLENTHANAVEFGPDFTTMRKMDRIYSGRPLTQQEILEIHDQIAFAFPGEWNTDSRVCLRIQAPYPATLLGLVTSVELNERNYRRPRR